MKHPHPAPADILSRTTLFGRLAKEDLDAVARHVQVCAFSAGQVIFLRDEESRDLFVVREGRVRLSILSSEGRELSLAHAAAGDVFGEIGVLDGGPRTANATALTEVKALALGRKALLTLMETRPAIAAAVIVFLCNMVRTTDMKMEGIALCSIEVRLARFLLSAIQLQTPAPKGKECRLPLEMSQSELALLLAASRPKVNKALSALEEAEAVRREGMHLVCDLEMLRTYSGID